jgi:hypothetical protein
MMDERLLRRPTFKQSKQDLVSQLPPSDVLLSNAGIPDSTRFLRTAKSSQLLTPKNSHLREQVTHLKKRKPWKSH